MLSRALKSEHITLFANLSLRLFGREVVDTKVFKELSKLLRIDSGAAMQLLLCLEILPNPSQTSLSLNNEDVAMSCGCSMLRVAFLLHQFIGT